MSKRRTLPVANYGKLYQCTSGQWIVHGELKRVSQVERNIYSQGKKGKMKNKRISEKEDGFGDQ